MNKTLLYFLTLFSLHSVAQQRDYKGTLINFHQELLNGQLKTPGDYRKYSFEGHAVEEDENPGYIEEYNRIIISTTGKDLNIIIEKINKSKIYDFGSISNIHIDLPFGENVLTYSLNKYEDEPITIGVALNGLSLFNHIRKDSKQLYETSRYAIIDDPDGYTNLRKGPSTNSEIIT